MLGYGFTRFTEKDEKKDPFQKLMNIFTELLVHTSGDVEESIEWLREIDKQHNLTDASYTVDDFVEDLIQKGFMNKKGGKGGGMGITAKTEQAIRKKSLDQIFGKLKKSTTGNHRSNKSGSGDELTADRRAYQFGDSSDTIDFTESFRNAQLKHGISDFILTQDDLEIIESDYKTNTSTVLMIDISHSMILYGEDRITPAKKVAMALSELIITKYPKDTLEIVVFGNDAWQISIKDLPYLQVGPFHTNTVAGLELAIDLLRRRKNVNKQIFMITDGKPSCLKVKGGYYKNSNGLDPKITKKCFTLADTCRKAKIPITTFMIANDPYLQRFVDDFTEANNGKAFFTSLGGLGDFIFQDYEKNRKKNLR